MNHVAIDKVVTGYLQARGLGVKVIRKKSSPLMWAIYITFLMWIWNRRFMTDFTTTLPPLGRMYLPDGHDARQMWRTRAHESMHVLQAKRDGQVRFSVKYLFPQILVLPALGALACVWWSPAVWFLGFLVFAAPWPAPWRVQYEREAYYVTAVCDALTGFEVQSPEYLAYQVNNYCSFAYYRQAWRRRPVQEFVLIDMTSADALVELARQNRASGYSGEIATLVLSIP